MARQGNYGFVIDSHFKPFSLQEMLVPFAAYKEQYDAAEAGFQEISDADKFQYLSNAVSGAEESKKIYDKYANDLHKYASELSRDGLTSGNRRALTSLKRRYTGEIGRLEKADAALQDERKRRIEQAGKDSSMLYAEDNLNMDMFLDGKNPNLYGISGNELYNMGLIAGKSASSRRHNTEDRGSILGGYYRNYVTSKGYTPEEIKSWSEQEREAFNSGFVKEVSTLPELHNEIQSILERSGAKQLKGDNYRRAYENAFSGLINGLVYEEDSKPIRDEGVLSADERMRLAIAMQKASEGSGSGSGSGSSTGSKGSSGKSGGSSNGRYPVEVGTFYISGRGGVPQKLADDEKPDNRATKVDITIKDGKYTFTVGGKKKDADGNYVDGLELGTIDGNGNFTLGSKLSAAAGDERYDTFDKYFGHGKDWWHSINHTFDPEYDVPNIEALARDVLLRASEGNDAYKNYEYYLFPDNVDYGNHGGGFYRRSYDRELGTIYNADPREEAGNAGVGDVPNNTGN